MISFQSTRDRYGYLSNLYPAPFEAQGVRWRSSEHFYQAMKTDDPDIRERVRNAPTPSLARDMGNSIPLRPDWDRVVDMPAINQVASIMGMSSMTTRDVAMVEGITRKFMDNPRLAISLKATAPRPIGTDIGYILTYVRDHVIPSNYGQERDNTDTVFDNFYLMLSGQGYEIPDDVPRQDIKGYQMDGTILDIFIDEPYTEARLKEMIKNNEALDPKPDYIILGYLAKGNISKILRKIAAYNNIKYYSPSEVLVTASNHRLNPTFRVIGQEDTTYSDLASIPMAELDSKDALAKQLGLKVGQILEIHDFSLHYRRIV